MIFARILSNWIAQLPSDGLILDVGCGLGAWIVASSRRGGRVVGSDIDKQACSIAFARVGRMCVGIVLYAAGTFPFKENSFQGMYTHKVIEHISDDKGLISEVYRVLKSGGSLVLTTPNAKCEPLDKRVHPAHVRHYPADQLSSRLRDQAFSRENLYWRMHPLCGMLDDTLSQVENEVLQVQRL
jgi:ubiquinone/menaquinone biosynthesis C-methylase UbiE